MLTHFFTVQRNILVSACMGVVQPFCQLLSWNVLKEDEKGKACGMYSVGPIFMMTLTSPAQWFLWLAVCFSPQFESSSVCSCQKLQLRQR